MKHQNVKTIFRAVFFMALFTIIISCGSDDDDSKPVTLSFAQSSLTVNEDAGKIYVKLELSKAFSKDITIRLETDGTAIETTDYMFDDDIRRIKIAKGETEVEIGINIIKDSNFEQPETLTLKIGNVDNKDVQVGQNKVDITINETGAAPVVNFKETTLILDEGIDSDGLTKIEVVLDKAVGFDVVVQYKIEGDALDSMYLHSISAPTIYSDYFINGIVEFKEDEFTHGKVTIPAGSTSGFIELQVYSDFLLEDDEIIAFTLESATGGITLGSKKTIVIDLYQEDGKIVGVAWNSGNEVDMDMFLWEINESNQPITFIHLEAAVSSNPQDTTEALIIPKWFPEGRFGMSYVYYEGNADPLNFRSIFIDLVNGEVVENSRQIFNGVYAITDQLKWDEIEDFPPIVQTFEIETNVIKNISQISLPNSDNGRKANTIIRQLNMNKMPMGTIQINKESINPRVKSSIKRSFNKL